MKMGMNNRTCTEQHRTSIRSNTNNDNYWIHCEIFNGGKIQLHIKSTYYIAVNVHKIECITGISWKLGYAMMCDHMPQLLNTRMNDRTQYLILNSKSIKWLQIVSIISIHLKVNVDVFWGKKLTKPVFNIFKILPTDIIMHLHKEKSLKMIWMSFIKRNSQIS